MREGLHFEDIAIGQVFRAGPRVITLEEMIAFARDNDPQYFHVDPEAAKESMFGGLVASGWQTAALSMRLLVESGAPFARGVVGAGGEIAWLAPVRPGDAISVESEVTALKRSSSRPDRGMASVRTKTFNQRGEIVQTLHAKMVVFARETP
jgi:acyl dehydratase